MRVESPAASPGRASTAAVLSALALVYVVWGSTYLGIRWALEGGWPPLLMAGARFLVAGVLMYAVLRWRGVPAPTRAQWRNLTVMAVLLLVTTGAGLVAVRSSDEARTERDQARSRQMAVAAASVRETNPGLSQQLALAAHQELGRGNERCGGGGQAREPVLADADDREPRRRGHGWAPLAALPASAFARDSASIRRSSRIVLLLGLQRRQDHLAGFFAETLGQQVK